MGAELWAAYLGCDDAEISGARRPEFAVVFVDIDPLEVSSSCDRIRRAIADVAWSELQPTLTVTVSISFAHFDEAGKEVWELVKVARKVDALESELAVRLFDRISRRLLLTDAGEQFLLRAQAIVAEGRGR